VLFCNVDVRPPIAEIRLSGELTEDTVFDALGYAIPIIREAFTQIAAEDRYVRFDTSARPYRLTRVYG